MEEVRKQALLELGVGNVAGGSGKGMERISVSEHVPAQPPSFHNSNSADHSANNGNAAAASSSEGAAAGGRAVELTAPGGGRGLSKTGGARNV